MRWLRKAIWRVVKRAWEDNDEFIHEEEMKNNRTKARLISSLSSNKVYVGEDGQEADRPRARSMSFKLYKCVGGHILETNVYNRREDEHEHTLYMIKEEDDFAQQVAQSIMLEMMKQ